MSAWSVAYYVYCLSGLGFLVVLILSVHRLMWLAYVGQTALAMMYAATLDGEFQRWFGLSQALSGPLTLLTGASLATYSYCLVAKLIQPGSNVDQWRPVLYAAALLSALAPFGLFYFDLDAVHRLLLVLLAGAFIAQALPPLTWGFLPRPLRPRAMPIIQLIILLAAVGTAVFSTYIELSEQQWLVARRMALACVVTAGVITMMYMTYIIERTRAASARRALAAAEREAATSRALLDAEHLGKIEPGCDELQIFVAEEVRAARVRAELRHHGTRAEQTAEDVVIQRNDDHVIRVAALGENGVFRRFRSGVLSLGHLGDEAGPDRSVRRRWVVDGPAERLLGGDRRIIISLTLVVGTRRGRDQQGGHQKDQEAHGLGPFACGSPV